MLTGGPGARFNATPSKNSRSSCRIQLNSSFTPQLLGCRVAMLKAAAPNHMQVRLSVVQTSSMSRLQSYLCELMQSQLACCNIRTAQLLAYSRLTLSLSCCQGGI
jgi:hypothetical protein